MVGTLVVAPMVMPGFVNVKSRSTFMTLWMLVGLVVGVSQLRTALEIFQNDGALGRHALVGTAFLALGIFCLARFRTVRLDTRVRPSQACWTEKTLLTQQKRTVEFLPKDIAGVRVVVPRMGASAVYLLVDGQERLPLVHLRQGETKSAQNVASAFGVDLTEERAGTPGVKTLWRPAGSRDFGE